jgi:hypothetical protein
VSDFLAFREGERRVLDNGMPPICWFALSTKSVADFSVKDTLAGGIGEITGTGYARAADAGLVCVMVGLEDVCLEDRGPIQGHLVVDLLFA